MFRRLASRGSVKAVAFAGGVALSAYMLNSAALQAAEEPSIFVINGFYMAMREKFTKPGTSIYYYLVEWDPAKLSWETLTRTLTLTLTLTRTLTLSRRRS